MRRIRVGVLAGILEAIGGEVVSRLVKVFGGRAQANRTRTLALISDLTFGVTSLYYNIAKTGNSVHEQIHATLEFHLPIYMCCDELNSISL
jgi:hypothetical protein